MSNERRLLPAMAGILAYAATAGAIPTIDFNITGPPGLVFYDGLGGPLLGVSIQISSITGTDTSQDGTFDCIGCFLSFQTENFTGGGSNFWVFGNDDPGSFLSISGDIDTDGDSLGDIPLSMVGDFIGPQGAVDLFTIFPFHFGVAAGIYLADYNVELTSFFGVSASSVGALLVTWGGFADPPGGIFAGSGPGLVRSVFAVTEPVTPFLLGAALIALAARGAKKNRE